MHSVYDDDRSYQGRLTAVFAGNGTLSFTSRILGLTTVGAIMSNFSLSATPGSSSNHPVHSNIYFNERDEMQFYTTAPYNINQRPKKVSGLSLPSSSMTASEVVDESFGANALTIFVGNQFVLRHVVQFVTNNCFVIKCINAPHFCTKKLRNLKHIVP